MKINGVEKVIESGITIAQLLDVEKVESPDYVTVQLNGEFTNRDDFETITLKENDELEFLYFMGGGSIGF